MQRIVDNVIAVAKESVKTFTYESLNNVVRLINGISALLLAILPGKTSILEGIHGWELRPTFRGPRLPRWMENGVSSFNQVIHQLSADSDSESSNLDYSSGGEDSDDIYPGTPLSQSSRLSRESSFPKMIRRSRTHWIRRALSWFLLPLKILFYLPCYALNATFRRVSRTPPKSRSHQPLTVHSPRRMHSLKDHVVQRATDRRRGVVEDIHLAVEIFIESIFDTVHKTAHSILTPAETSRRLFRWFSSGSTDHESDLIKGSGISVPTDVLADDDPTPVERKTFHNSLNTDARTCQDVITELGYPYEAIRVVTADGYVLLLERIPRFLLLRSSSAERCTKSCLSSAWNIRFIDGVGIKWGDWFSSFCGFDQGYDVFLGNFRGLVSREHIDKNISSRQYWTYSINEHGMEDIPAIIEKIHQIKISELNSVQSSEDKEENSDQPYKMCAICHSLGGAAILMYVLTHRIEGKPHRLSRLILLSPAGFHHDSSFMFTMVECLFLFLAPILAPFVPAFYIPTRFFRMLLNKLARDFHNLPAVGGLVQTLMSYVVGGDSSNWVGVLGLPHYNMNDMPGVAFRVALHLAQMKRSRKFIMFDYGNEASNVEIYGSSVPLDLGECYGFFDIPVDLVAGRKDKVIKPSMVRQHYKLMKDAGAEVSYNEFEYAHLDFTFSHHEELLSYVMSRLLLVGSNSKMMLRQKTPKLKRKDPNFEELVDK